MPSYKENLMKSFLAYLKINENDKPLPFFDIEDRLLKYVIFIKSM